MYGTLSLLLPQLSVKSGHPNDPAPDKKILERLSLWKSHFLIQNDVLRTPCLILTPPPPSTPPSVCVNSEFLHWSPEKAAVIVTGMRTRHRMKAALAKKERIRVVWKQLGKHDIFIRPRWFA
ncbi:hypothetical protein TNCV_2340711 [Trichonephila clavipes]|nr:hypothetical protein TNCV_2340711 [Trichonephila clavipes]